MIFGTTPERKAKYETSTCAENLMLVLFCIDTQEVVFNSVCFDGPNFETTRHIYLQRCPAWASFCRQIGVHEILLM